ncbi:MAG: HAD family hydrolase [Oscillospiraceae bacterium]
MSNIRLIATDMDGTLLDDYKQLPKDFFKLLNILKSMGIEFIIASGRSYVALEYIFGEYAKSMSFICDNGAYVVINGEVVSVSIIEHQTVKDVIKECYSLENVSPVLCGMEDIYYNKSVKRQFKEEINNFYINFTDVDDVLNINDNIFKIAICDLLNPLKNSYPILNGKFGDTLSVVVSGERWEDVMNKGIDKGYALEIIQNRLNVSIDETMAFGDFYNDIPLLNRAYYSYVMDNANNDMKSYGRFIADKNSNNGVVKAICSRLGVAL